jgi:hypothetical protein
MVSVKAAEADRTGSSVGGYPYTSEAYPWPTTPEGLPLAPLLQLDLDEIEKTTGNNCGEGLLQAWLPDRSCWEEFQPLMRVIPRSAIKSDVPLTEKPTDTEAEAEMQKTGFGFETSEKPDLDAMSNEERDFHNNWCWIGFDWTLARHDYETWAPPTQIVGWQLSDGLNLPDWYDLRDLLDEQYGEIMDSRPEISALVNELRELIEKLPRDNGDLIFWPSKFNDFPEWASLGWNPLFTFRGPHEDGWAASDEYRIFWKRNSSGFDYEGVGYRDFIS